jgi:hypothetical protein
MLLVQRLDRGDIVANDRRGRWNDFFHGVSELFSVLNEAAIQQV